jgi:hypothetical protein
MEEHRLTPMQPGYDKELFNELYENTKALRKKLVSEIDHKRFGVEPKDIESWFTVKFIHAFNRYFGEKEPNILKAHIIKSLQFFKNRILRSAYSQKNQVNNNCIDIESLYNLKEPLIEYEYNEREFFVKLALEFMKNNLSENAYRVLEVELHPPLYILDRLKDKESTTKIPSNLIADYLGFKEGKSLVNKCRKEIEGAILMAKDEIKLELI